jgi:hypothetical protein
MQLFIDNWRTTLLADASAADTSLSVLPAKADLLIGLGAGDYYELTLARVVEGIETAWEVVRVDNAGEGLLAVTRGADPLDWLEGELISARLTAGALRTIQGVMPVIRSIGEPAEAPTGPGMYINEYTPYGVWIAIFKNGEYWAWERIALYSNLPE